MTPAPAVPTPEEVTTARDRKTRERTRHAAHVARKSAQKEMAR